MTEPLSAERLSELHTRLERNIESQARLGYGLPDGRMQVSLEDVVRLLAQIDYLTVQRNDARREAREAIERTA